MKYILIGLTATVIYLLFQNRFDDQYQAGYREGIKTALKTNPPSEELEIACVGLWIGEQNRKYWNKELRSAR